MVSHDRGCGYAAACLIFRCVCPEPLYLINVPIEVASKIIKAECQCFGKRDNDIVTAILGKQAPVWCNRLPSLGWISFGKKNDQRKWVALTITDAQVADFRWKFAQARVKKQFTHIGDATKIALRSL